MNLFTNSMKYNKVNGFIYMSMRTIERSEDHMTCEFKIKIMELECQKNL